jgi:hypothetical protein
MTHAGSDREVVKATTGDPASDASTT